MRRCWLALLSAMAVLTLVTVLTSPSGNWSTLVFGIEYQQYSDPGGWYLGSALAMTEPGTTAVPFVGHPGQPLSLTLQAVARGLHAGHKLLGGHENFAVYASGHLPTIIAACLFVMTLINGLACYAVYRLSLRLGISRASSLIAAFAYATCWQTLFYMARISVEPIATLLFLSTAICCLRSTASYDGNNHRAAIVSSAAAGACLSLLVYTKIHLALPVAAAGGLWMLVLPVSRGWRTVPWSTRLAIWCAFASGAIVVFVAGLRFTDWHFFFAQWRNYIPGSDATTKAHDSVVGNARETFDKVVDSFRQIGIFFASFVNKGQLRQSTAVEAGFYVIALGGLARSWSLRLIAREKLVFLLIALLALAPIVLFRRGFHYWTLYVAMLAPFFGTAIYSLAARVAPVRAGVESRTLVAFSMTVIVHAGAIACYFEAKRYDASQFENARAWFAAFDDLRPGDKIGLANNQGDGNQFYHLGVYFPYQHQYFLKQDSAVGRAFLDRLVQVPSNLSPEELRARNIAILLDSREAPNDQRAWYIRWRDIRK